MSTLQSERIGWFRYNSFFVPRAVLCAGVIAIVASVPSQAETESATRAPAPHKMQANDPAAAQMLMAQGARLIADYGGYGLYEVSDIGAAFGTQPGVEIRDEYNFILLNAAKLDTSKSETQALRKSVGAFAGRRMNLVQFAGPVQPAWRETLLETGVQIIDYIPRNAYLVYGNAEALAAVQALAAKAPHIQWEGAYLDEYKIHPAARAVDALGNPRAIGTSDFTVQLVADPQANPTTLKLVDQLKLRPILKQSAVLQYVNVIVTIAPENLALIASQPDVISIQPFFKPQLFDERQDQILAGNLSGSVPTSPGYLAWLQGKGFSQGQFTTSGFAVDLSDTGIDNGTTNVNHPGLHTLGDPANSSRVAYNRLVGQGRPPLNDCIGHGTLNAHMVAGYDDTAAFPFTDSMGYHYGLGVCPFVKVGASVIFTADGNFTSPDFTTLQSTAYRDGARISNNSWGETFVNSYDTWAQEYDALVRDAQPANAPAPAPGNQEMVIVFANGNDGPSSQSVHSPATGKNVISVGASKNVQPIGGPDGCFFVDSDANNANDIASYSTRGPGPDGRHKPDMVAPGTRVAGGVPQDVNPGPTGTADPCFLTNQFTGVCGLPSSLFFPTNQQFFSISTGTSHAAPAIVGGCALLRQFFINRFSSPPSAAMTKAYLMNSARYLTGIDANDSLWSDNQGMGEMNLGMAFDDTRRIIRDQLPIDLFTASGQVRTFTGNINNANQPFRITLAWTDAPG